MISYKTFMIIKPEIRISIVEFSGAVWSDMLADIISGLLKIRLVETSFKKSKMWF
jgi:hypothetical protein